MERTDGPCVGAAVVEQLAGAVVVEDEEAEVHAAEHGELVRHLQQAAAALAEGRPPRHVVADPLHLRPPAAHPR